MRHNPWVTSEESAFRTFMKILNRHAGGILFEAISDDEADSLMEHYALRAREHFGRG
jgi:hypothetical protein